jgi:hypothetical protein
MEEIKTIFYFVPYMDKDTYDVKVQSEEISPNTIVFSKNNKSIFVRGTQYGTMDIEDLEKMLKEIFTKDDIVLPIASKTNRGVVKIGDGLMMTGDYLDEISIDFEDSVWDENISKWIKNLFL